MGWSSSGDVWCWASGWETQLFNKFSPTDLASPPEGRNGTTLLCCCRKVASQPQCCHSHQRLRTRIMYDGYGSPQNPTVVYQVHHTLHCSTPDCYINLGCPLSLPVQRPGVRQKQLQQYNPVPAELSHPPPSDHWKI